MKIITLLLITIAYLTTQANAEETSTYSTKYDGVNLDEVLGNDRLLNNYVNCLLDNGPCTPDGKELKKNLPDAIQNDCKKCSDRQREGADQVMEYIIDHREEDWKKLELKYNSDGSYKKKYLERKQAKQASKESDEKSNEKVDKSDDKKE
uniref:Chemosensory protein 4 n=1 Tax=Conogethes pinicolalis TaxID=1178461 RepID=A0A5P8N5N3_9NEOP|nr:chemosensory protein 4 [Conogethes pinicolalis]